MSEENYIKYRGKCKELCEQAVAENSSLTLVRGHYYCPVWNNEEQHWWTVKPDGTIHDPSRLQFPSAGMGIYTPFDGMIQCANCGKDFKEDSENASFESRYAFCSNRCHGIFVGIY